MKKNKKEKKIKTVYTVSVYGYNGKVSGHIFMEEQKAWEFYTKLKFSLDVIDDEYLFVSFPQAQEIDNENY